MEELERDNFYETDHTPEEVITILMEDALNHKHDQEGQYLYLKDQLQYWGVTGLTQGEYRAVVALLSLYRPNLRIEGI